MATDRISRSSLAYVFLALALAMLPFGDFSLAGHDPWFALGRMLQGFLAPDFGAVEQFGWAILLTVAFALCGVATGGIAGLILAPFYSRGPVRTLCIALRSVHELFWALMLMQVLGISPTTGVLAIALPYAGIFAKVFAEQYEEADQRPARTLPPGVDALSRFAYARLPLVIHSFGGGRPGPELGGLDGGITCHWRALPLLYARESDRVVEVLETVAAPNRIKKLLKLYDPFRRMVFQGRGHKLRALFDRDDLPPREKAIRQRIKQEGFWMR